MNRLPPRERSRHSESAGHLADRGRKPACRGRLDRGLCLDEALGNLLDRVARGFVVDFIHISHWPVFNVADIAIVLGGLCLAWTTHQSEPKSVPTPDSLASDRRLG